MHVVGLLLVDQGLGLPGPLGGVDLLDVGDQILLHIGIGSADPVKCHGPQIGLRVRHGPVGPDPHHGDPHRVGVKGPLEDLIIGGGIVGLLHVLQPPVDLRVPGHPAGAIPQDDAQKAPGRPPPGSLCQFLECNGDLRQSQANHSFRISSLPPGGEGGPKGRMRGERHGSAQTSSPTSSTSISSLLPPLQSSSGASWYSSTAKVAVRVMSSRSTSKSTSSART